MISANAQPQEWTGATETSASRSRNHRRATTAFVWTLQLLVAAMFFFSGTLKLSGAALMVQMFDAIGFGQWFRYVTGALEFAGAAGLLVAAVAPFSAIVLAAVMIGAVATHVFVIGGSAAVPIALFVALIAIVWIRRDQIVSASV